ncbi:ribonuclease III [Candidatus Giovannonibacteria bacterium RIFCSPHIGHO2_02_FULL_46_20]|uniref:Ribonuclease 3 n=1 Tax=Candidatus Giovannonibacteria bacterium RIFCSPHIGHO2_02_FULL_46_20 TaxID=1798338 RepID=A0A1F5WE59_9BACT|nr:MAG: ribonuclease III [Candidatus Giovannonibacteria bacterium RIFCSPHIGHO2_02_FULL_46_20]
MKDFSKFETTLGITFKSIDLLKIALTHRSYLNEHPLWQKEHNERLEFLGDAVLELVVTEYLYRQFPDKPEGELTSLRAALVNAQMLGSLASDLGLNDFILLSRGEARDVGRARLAILANTFESVTGAIYLDQGYGAAQAFLERVLFPRLKDVLDKKLYRDAKSLFQEEAQERVSITPTYEVIKEWGPDHDRHFVVGVYLGHDLIAQGEGPSKQAAQQQAAEAALNIKKWG